MPVTKETRRNIIQTIKSEGINWSGRFEDVEFLSRIYDLEELPSHDYRYKSAKGDITQHTIWAPGDWSEHWVFDDKRFDLLNCSDEKFLRFLCEMIHPLVRPVKEEQQKLLEMFNEELKRDGYQIVEEKTRFGNIRYAPVGVLPSTVGAIDHLKDIAETISSEYLQREIVRMTSSIETDPELAIGTSKEFLETICKTILRERGKSPKGDEDIPKLVKLTIDELSPIIGVHSSAKADETLRKTIGALSTLTQSIAELRNLHGTGHGKDATSVALEPRHAALAVNAAVTIAFFLYQSHEKGRSSGTSHT